MSLISNTSTSYEASFLLESMTDAVIFTNLDFIIQTWNKGAEEMYGLTAQEVIGMPYAGLLMHEFLTDDQEIACKKLEASGKWKGEVLLTRKDGKKTYLEINCSRVKNHTGTIIGYISICRDITDMRRIKEAMVAEKSELIKAIIEAQEKERIELSSELHDNVNQILTTCKLLLEIAGNNPADPRFIDECYKNIQLVIQEIRNISHNLTPHTLKDLGLAAAVRDIMEKVNQSGQLTIRLLSFLNLEEDKISPDIKLTLFRIIQENINNVLKHSRATELKISISIFNDRVRLQLGDNGLGFDEKTVKKGLGLNNIHNRVEYYKGCMQMRTSPGRGCELTIELPCALAGYETAPQNDILQKTAILPQ